MDKHDNIFLGGIVDDDTFSFQFDRGLEEDDMFGEEGALSVDSGMFLPNQDGTSEFLLPDPDKVPVIENAMKQQSAEYQARPAQERTDELMGYMRPHRIVLLGIIAAAQERISNDDMIAKINELRAHKFSVYSPSNLCTMLEQAGSLNRVNEDGTPYVRVEPKPEIVVIDGVEYYKPTYPPTIYWEATEAGLHALAENNPEERIERLFTSEADFISIYKAVLQMTSVKGGAAMTALSGAIDNIPSIAAPRRFFVQHFVENLERCEAVEWDGFGWIATDLGKKVLVEHLADVPDAPVTPVNPDGTYKDATMQGAPRKAPGAIDGRLITETQGVNW